MITPCWGMSLGRYRQVEARKNMGHIKADNLTLGYSREKIIQGIGLSIKKGDFLFVIGPSGVGNSTLLMGLNATTSSIDGGLRVLCNNLGTIRPVLTHY